MKKTAICHASRRASRPRPSTAVRPDEDRSRLRRMLLDHYLIDPKTKHHLLRIARRHEALLREVYSTAPSGPTDWDQLAHQDNRVDEFLDDVDDFINRRGLGYFSWGDDTDGPRDQVLRWCGLLLDIEPTPIQTTSAPSRELHPEPDHVELTIHVDYLDRWDPRTESMRSAQRRMERLVAALVRAKLQQVAEGFEQAGYVFPDSHPQLDLHLSWLFQRVALGWSLAKIQVRSGESGCWAALGTIRNATNRLARKIGVTLPRGGRRR